MKTKPLNFLWTETVKNLSASNFHWNTLLQLHVKTATIIMLMIIVNLLNLQAESFSVYFSVWWLLSLYQSIPCPSCMWAVSVGGWGYSAAVENRVNIPNRHWCLLLSTFSQDDSHPLQHSWAVPIVLCQSQPSSHKQNMWIYAKSRKHTLLFTMEATFLSPGDVHLFTFQFIFEAIPT